MAEHIDSVPDEGAGDEGSHDLEQVTPAFSLSAFSWRVRLLGVVMTVALVAVSTAIWQSPTARQAVADAVPLPKVVDQALRPEADAKRAGPARSKPELRSPDESAVDELRAQVAALTVRLRAGRVTAAAQAGAKLGDYLRTPQGRRALASSGLSAEQLAALAGQAANLDKKPKPSANEKPSGNKKPGGKTGGKGKGDDGKGKGKGGATPTPPPPPRPRSLHCWDFRWQQDAQAAYVANLRDPWGLDGAPGPNNDDGLACSDLPTDPKRPASTPVGARKIPLPVTPKRDQLVRPDRTLFGVFTDQAPFAMSEVDSLSTKLAKAPSALTYFQGWDQDFRGDGVIAAWRRGMLPIVSWESRPHTSQTGPGANNTVNPDYTLKKIIDGEFDSYIDKWATDAAALGLPFVIRFDHEMNGFWYPWSEQTNGNAKGEYVAAWRHVHDRFAAAGATNVLWLWSPNVIGTLKHINLAELYPGDDYVDWTGLVGYYRKPIPGKAASFGNTFGESLTALRGVAAKPIYLSEVGATETGGNKAAWIKSLFDELPSNPDVIGFNWFNRAVTAVPIGQKDPVTNDWRITSSAGSLAAFKNGIADSRYDPLAPPPPTQGVRRGDVRTEGRSRPARTTP